MQNDIVRRPVVRPQTRKPEDAATGKYDNQQEPVPTRVEDVVRQTEDLSPPTYTEQNSSAHDSLGGGHPDEQANSQADELPQEVATQQVDQAEVPQKNSGHGAVIVAAVFIFIALAGLAVYANLKPETQENNTPQPAALNQPEPEVINDPALNNPTTESPSGLNVQP